MTLAMLGRRRKCPLFKTATTFLYPFLLPMVLVIQAAWTTRDPLFIAMATLEQCKLDCAGNTTVDLQVQAEKSGRYWSIWDTQRLVGPTEPAPELNATYPYARAPLPLPYTSFCQLGCSLFFSGAPQNTTCCAFCDDVYARNVSVGISDHAEKARLECRDGCNIASLRCQPGFSCWGGVMSECEPGTYRNTSYDMITSCVECPKGTFRSRKKGRGIQDCELCPVNTYLNTTGATRRKDCIRCPDGLFAEFEGSAECSCITQKSCLPEWQNYQRDSTPYIGRQ